VCDLLFVITPQVGQQIIWAVGVPTVPEIKDVRGNRPKRDPALLDLDPDALPRLDPELPAHLHRDDYLPLRADACILRHASCLQFPPILGILLRLALNLVTMFAHECGQRVQTRTGQRPAQSLNGAIVVGIHAVQSITEVMMYVNGYIV